MNPKLLFWVPALLRTGLLFAVAGLVWWWFGPIAGLSLALAGMAVAVFTQLSYLYKLGEWLDEPHSTRLPDGWGAWTDAFARLYRLRRDDERHQAELTEWLARFRQAMHLLPEGVAIMDDVLFLEWCNPAVEKHLGLTMERDKGLRVTNLVRHPDFIDYIVLGRYEQPLTLSFRGRKLECRIIPFENRRQILVTHDATDTERIEAMRRDFIANASHELRTPLTVIVGFLEIALSDPGIDVATRMAHLNLMTEQAHRMQRLIQDMLTLSRLESDEYPMKRERVDVRTMIDSIALEARALSGGRHQIEVSVDGPDVMGSMEELRSAFANLASNAVRYSPNGGTIRLAWTRGADALSFAVTDCGIGIDPEHIPRLTERFYRVDKSRSRETQGTGLGLAIVKHVLLRHGGKLTITSQPGKGSTFSASLPNTSLPA
ncbi:two-component system phosphate regulon sensor histidine kinase PhoR [Massilia sp. UYP32]|jgi:two-component system, OmpR family, phosphate regulon sensor histidine kinase PhoR|uniref:Phosphate regulon sensor protein PhoR n=4 Tax=Massilia timonae TaxID=47229 RepID=K9DTF7_9BURK|nr:MULTISPECIES: phosphate regulon sensor histidine kinase PhoR [Massilia]EKU80660.1 phosphate regulon sensor kinase PhoR [Massilia timonae CCUG 45783]OIJ43710.1 phosphate regulon sensor kinase PhoR [Massilia timonae]QYG02209.1 phosphate regulon sensor histidine kinase PhoR [Massilia sp. NP310]